MTDTQLVTLTKATHRNYNRRLARGLARQTISLMDESQFIREPETIKFVTDQYFCAWSGNRIASSRTTPVKDYHLQYKPGQWRISDLWGIYGRTVEMLCLLNPHNLAMFEADYALPGVNHEGRGDDARRYAEWMREGLVAPAITVLEREDGRLCVSDGHRRLAGAKMAGVKILGWVSFLMPTGKQDYNGEKITAGLTLEGAKQGTARAYNAWRERQQQTTGATDAERMVAA